MSLHTRIFDLHPAPRLTIAAALILALSIISPSIGLAVESPSTWRPAAQADSTAYSISDVQFLAASDDRLLRLSPDGTAIVAERRDDESRELCVIEVPAMRDRVCAELDAAGATYFDMDSVVWSPDSSRVVFSENVFTYLVDGDIWLLDAVTGALMNLTDDGDHPNMSRVALGAENLPEGVEIFLDVQPAWAPDGTQIAFARTPVTNDGMKGTAIYLLTLGTDRLPVNDPDLMITLDRDTPGIIFTPMRWTADGQELVYTFAHPSADHPRNGLWAVSVDAADDPRLIATETAPGRGFPILMDLRGDPGVALTTDRAGFTSTIEYPHIFLIDIDSGVVTPVEPDPRTMTSDQAAINFAALSPDGQARVEISRYGIAYPVILRDEVNGSITPLDFPLGHDDVIVSTTRTFALDWSDADVLFLPFGPFGGGLLVTLASVR